MNNEKELKSRLMEKPKETLIELYLQVRFERAFLEDQLALTEKALELLAEEFIEYEQSLKEECVIEGGVLTDTGYEVVKRFLIDRSIHKAKEMIENE